MVLVMGASLFTGCENTTGLAPVGEATIGEITSEISSKSKIDFGEMTHGGSGCSAGSVDEKIKSKSIDVEFEELGIAGDNWRAVCNLALPFEAKSGYQLGLAGLTLLATVDEDNDATIRVSKFFPGQDGKKIVIDWPPSEDEEEDNFDTVWSECGKDSIARWSIEVRSPEHATVDILETDLKYTIRACD